MPQQCFRRKTSQQIIFDEERLTMQAVWTLRDRFSCRGARSQRNDRNRPCRGAFELVETSLPYDLVEFNGALAA